MNRVAWSTGFMVLTLMVILLISSCMTTRTNVGEYQETRGRSYNYASGKQVWLFWGILPMGRTNVNTPGDGNCQVVTKYTVGDVLISTVTLGVVKTYSIQVRAKRE